MSIPKVLLAATGCKLNQAEADLWKAWYASRGYEVMLDEAGETASQDVQICLVTTCTVTESADRSSTALIRRLHRKYPEAEIKVTGCGAERIAERMSALPGVTEVIGYQHKERLISALHYRNGNETQAIARNRAFLRVGDGCDRGCAYCVVSRVRGPVKSKDAEKITGELHVLANQGFGEVVLVALNLGIWGQERGENLACLLKRIDGDGKRVRRARRVRRVPRVRLTSLEPDTVTDELLEVIADSPWICPHFHIPLQSGDDLILNQMNRSYRTKEFAELMEKIRRMFPDACIGTDVIASTPGEDEESFKKTVDFLKVMPIDHLHAFTYSPRPATPMFERKVSHRQSPRERTRALRAIGAEKSLAFRRRFTGKTRPGVVLSPTRVLTDNYIDVSVPATNRQTRSLVDVRITDVTPDKTRGVVQ
jgi:threonylcarbamoyladenosine tRNA methylthiotransferase MtaB